MIRSKQLFKTGCIELLMQILHWEVTNALMITKHKSNFFFFPQEIGHELWHLRNDNGSQTNTRASARV